MTALSGLAETLAQWAHGYQPAADDLALADPASWTWDNAAQVLG
jgi:hypothetical protein